MQDRSLERQQRFAELVTLRVNSRANSEYRKNNHLEPGDFELTARQHTENSRWFVFVAKHKGEFAWTADGREALQSMMGNEANDSQREVPCVVTGRDDFFLGLESFANECIERVCNEGEKSVYLWMHQLEPGDLTIEVRDGDRDYRYTIKHKGEPYKYLSSRAALKEHLRLD